MLICESCGKTFLLPAKMIEVDPDFNKRAVNLKENQFLSRPLQVSGYETHVEIPCCPFCHSIKLMEASK